MDAPRHGCRSDEPITWTRSDFCRSNSSRCGSGDLDFALQFGWVPRCGRYGNALRTFNHSMKLVCLAALAHGGRRHASAAAASSRILLMGSSNAIFLWHAMAIDESSHWPGIDYPTLRAKRPLCETTRPDFSHWVFGPHRVDFARWDVLTPTLELHAGGTPSHPSERPLTVGSNCIVTGSIGGGALHHLASANMTTQRASGPGHGSWVHWPFSGSGAVAPTTPYHAVVLYLGQWDASFTRRNASGVRAGLDSEIRHLLATWPETSIVVLTLTPCGGYSNGHSDANVAAACDFVPVLNDAIRSVARPLAPRVRLLDAYSMVTAHPLAKLGGTPPGLWESGQSRGWHFNPALTPSVLDKARKMTPPSAAGEMNHALANRVWDVLCPAAEKAEGDG